MTTIGGIPSHNGGGSDAWSRSWTHLRVERRSVSYCRVTFDHPPTNAITETTIAELAELVALIEQDRDLNVVVFDSANTAFYLEGAISTPAWMNVLVRLARAPLVSIAAIRGRARGAGSEFVLACDLRFASRENTALGRVEVGSPMGRLSRLVGRCRALEILLVADDLDGPRAQQYGCVNRLVADDRLDATVHAVASRLARGDHDD